MTRLSKESIKSGHSEYQGYVDEEEENKNPVQIVIKKLAHDSEWEDFDDNVCTLAGQQPKYCHQGRVARFCNTEKPH